VIYLFGVAAIIVVGIAEYVLGMMWNERYCTTGIPIFARRVERARGLADVDLDEAERRSATAAAQGFRFRRFGADKIAFHEHGIGLMHYTPIMRGLIRHDAAEATVVVLGLVNWSVLLFVMVVVLVVLAAERAIVDIGGWIGGLLAILYFIQAFRFWRVGSRLAAPAHHDPQLPQP
jgi:hypothetical protein